MCISSKILVVCLGLSILLGCEKKEVKSLVSPDSPVPTVEVNIYVSSSSLDTTVGTVDIAGFNFYTAAYSQANTFDSVFSKGFYIGMLLNLIDTIETTVDVTYLPYGTYNKLSFVGRAMQLTYLHAIIRKTSFEFWNGDRLTLNFPDSLLTVSNDETIKLLVHFDLNKALNPKLGGVDISKAKDGNGDGHIDITPAPYDTDGNAVLADSIFASIVRNCSIQRMK